MNQSEALELMVWSDQHRSCAVCWWPSFDYSRDMEVHHIVGGANRAKGHKVFNYLKLCDRCHQVYHSGKVAANVPPLTMGHLLTAKKESDEENFDLEKLAKLKNRKALHWDPEPIPQFYLDERVENTRRMP